MSIDYYVTYPCKVRESVSDVELLNMEKSYNQASMVLDMMRNDPKTDKSIPESEWSFTTITRGPNGDEKVNVKIYDLFAEALPLPELSKHCNNCSANLLNLNFGCGGVINYPISRQSESWLISRLPENLDSQAGKLLLQAISDFSYDGKNIDDNRSRTDLYESSQCLERRWGGFFSKKTTISSSSILQMSFTVGSLQAAHAKMIAYFLGFLNDDFKPSGDASIQPQQNDDQSTADLKRFYLASSFAGINGFSVFIDA